MRRLFFSWKRGESLDFDSFVHVSHCIESLRQDIICNADDTPRYGGLVGGQTAEGQFRMCKDFSRLAAWAKEHTGCHRHDVSIPTLERYRFCPEGTPYMDKVREMFPTAVELET